MSAEQIYFVDFTAEGSDTSLLTKIDHSTGKKVASVIGYYDSLKGESTHKYDEYKKSGLEKGYIVEHKFSLEELNKHCLERLGNKLNKRMEVHNLFQVVENFFQPSQLKNQKENDMSNEVNYKFWKGGNITSMTGNNIFVFGSNPEGRHGAGAAAAAVKFGAVYGNGRGVMGNTYGLVTKNLKAGYAEKSSGITYDKEGMRSVSPEQISANIDELYECANQNPELKFFITYQYDPKQKNLNGYTQEEMLDLFIDSKVVPANIRFHESYKELIKKKIENKNTHVNTSASNFKFFWKQDSIYNPEHPSSFSYKNVQFISAEQFVSYSKAKMFNNDEVADKIMHYNDALLVKDFIAGNIDGSSIVKDEKNLKTWIAIHKNIHRLVRDMENVDEAKWSEKFGSIMMVANREKFAQNPDFKNELLNLKDKKIVYSNPHDKISGIGLEESNPKSKDESMWEGKNVLGETLENVRDALAPSPKSRTKRRM